MAITIDLKGKVVLITGASSGIGSGAAEMFARAGAFVAGCDLKAEHADFSDLATKYLTSTFYYPCDVTDLTQLQGLVEATIQKFGKIDILVSNAGANIFEGAKNCDEERWEQNIRLNLTAHWQLAKLCRPYLEKQGGVIIIMSSNHAFGTIPGCFPYNVAKSALDGLIKSLAIEWAPAIRTVGIAPGFIDTPGNQRWFDSFPNSEIQRENTINEHPVKRIGTIQEIGMWCVFLASEYAGFANGVVYLLDGGKSALL